MSWIKKYAELLTHYSLYLKRGELLYLRSTVLAHELVYEIARNCAHLGVRLEVELDYQYKEDFIATSTDLEFLNYFGKHRIDLITNCDAYLVIRAPFEKLETIITIPESEKIRSSVISEFQNIYFKRLGDGSLKRSLCQFPTTMGAQLAEMSFEDHKEFILHACALDQDIPENYWKELSKRQQVYVDHLNSIDQLIYEHKNWKISCSTKGRKWINSDGKSNMPSGEVFTSPIEESVEGEIYFDYPTMIFGEHVQGIHLQVKNGLIIQYSAFIGQETLDKVFATEGAKRFGEVAIGTNLNIQQASNNILFDEKIGGTVHMAVGQSYYQCGGLNKSSIHWDLITDMRNGGKIFTDGKLIYENGEFLI